MLMKKIPSCFNFGVLIITHHENRLIMRNSIHLFELKRKFPHFSFYTVVHDIRLRHLKGSNFLDGCLCIRNSSR